MKNKAFLFILPCLVVMGLVGFLPILVVINYSIHYLIPGCIPTYSGLQNFIFAMHDANFTGAIGRQFLFTFEVLIIQIPLGLALAHLLPRKGMWVGVCLVLLGIPLLIPWNVVGLIWRVFSRGDVGVLPAVLEKVGILYLPTRNAVQAWWTIVITDTWHWTPLVILLCYAGLLAVPQEFYQAAKIDAASKWAQFRHITLPRLRFVLIVAVLLRGMDSFRIFDEPFILTGGGPGTATEFLNQFTTRQAIGGFDMGFGGAVSLVYLLFVLVLCWVLYTTMTKIGGGA